MSVTGMNHFTILTDDVDGTVRFYDELMGLSPGPRPPLPFPGAWLYSEGEAILHIVGDRPATELKPGVIDHMAFTSRDLSGSVARLKARGIKYSCRQQVGSGVWQVFFLDPNGAKVELDFASDERLDA